MTRFTYVVFAFLAVLLSGCGSMPKTPELLVQNAKGGKMFSEKDIFEVKRPLAEVSEVLRKKAAECFNQEIAMTSPGDSSGGIRLNHTQVHELTSKMFVGKEHTRLTLQARTTKGSTELGDMPRDGWFMMVVDAYPVNQNTTRVESYYQQTSYHGAFTAIKQWLTGTNLGCPDLTE